MSNTAEPIPKDVARSALVRPEDYRGLTLVVSPTESLRRMQELQAFIKEVLVEGIDYGQIPGIDKKILLQPGAQKLAEVYGFAHKFVDIKTVEDWDRPFFFYRRGCVLTARRDGLYVGDGIGSCNSKEDRYAWRWLWPEQVPKGIDRSTLKERSTRNGKQQFRMANEDIFSLVNTIEKMACKRSYIHAVTAVTRSSGLFTQDVEDLPDDVYGEAEETRSWESGEGKKTDRIDKVDAFLAALADAKTDAACQAVGRDMVAAHKAGQINDKQRVALQEAIRARRAAIGQQAPKDAKPEPPNDADEGP